MKKQTLLALVYVAAGGLVYMPSSFAAKNVKVALIDDVNGYQRGRAPILDEMNGSKADVQLTRQIRTELMKDSSLSLMAQNVAIVTVDGIVTLKGSVKNADERARIVQVAERVAGKSVHNEIQVK